MKNNLKNKIIKIIFYENKYKKTTVFVCPKNKKYVNAAKYIIVGNFYIKRKLPDCPHCGFSSASSVTDHYEILHGNVLRPNFLGRLFLLDSILMSGVIFK
jgi:hypothetical protein